MLIQWYFGLKMSLLFPLLGILYNFWNCPQNSLSIKHVSFPETQHLLSKFKCGVVFLLHALFISSTFINNVRLKLAKKLESAKQHPEAEFCYLKNIYILYPSYHPKIMGHILKNKQKNKCVCIHTINNNENEGENEK